MNKKVLVPVLVSVDAAIAEAQKLKAGTRVEVVDLPERMRHFTKGKGTVLNSYSQLFSYGSKRDANIYAILFDDGTQSCWYPLSTLRVID